MSGGFEVYGVQQNGGGSSEETRAKFDALNKHVVETVGLQTQKTLVGVVSSIVDLGSQPLPDAEYALEGDQVGKSEDDLNDARTEEELKRGIHFGMGYNGDTKQRELMKKVPQKPLQCVALAIDFPNKIVDKGQFFGESNPQPLRIWYGGKFWNGEKMVIQNLTPLKERPITKGGSDWSLNPKSILHKMAVAAELVADTKTPFKSGRIDELLGKAFLFTVQVFFEQGKGANSGKQYYKEKVTFTGALMEGMPVPELARTNLVMVKNPNNDLQAVKEIPAHVRNTIERSKEFAGSAIEAQLSAIAAESGSGDQGAAETQEVEANETKAKEAAAPAGSTDW